MQQPRRNLTHESGPVGLFGVSVIDAAAEILDVQDAVIEETTDHHIRELFAQAQCIRRGAVVALQNVVEVVAIKGSLVVGGDLGHFGTLHLMPPGQSVRPLRAIQQISIRAEIQDRPGAEIDVSTYACRFESGAGVDVRARESPAELET